MSQNFQKIETCCVVEVWKQCSRYGRHGTSFGRIPTFDLLAVFAPLVSRFLDNEFVHFFPVGRYQQALVEKQANALLF